MNHSGAAIKKLGTKSYVFQNKPKIISKYAKKAHQQFYMQTKNILKLNDLKQFTMWNELSHRNTFPDKIKYSRICLIRHLKGIRKKWRINWRIMQTGENSITEARMLYHSNSYT